MSSDAKETLLDLPTKPTLLEYIEGFLPFTLPRIPLPQTAKNLDKAAARLILAKAEVVASDLERASKLKDAKASAKIEILKVGSAHVHESGHRFHECGHC
jgi:hypothetical protein